MSEHQIRHRKLRSEIPMITRNVRRVLQSHLRTTLIYLMKTWKSRCYQSIHHVELLSSHLKVLP